ncbi:MAG: penicillin-binding protein 2 [Flavobacteriales bacterium]|nr:penicillin-binding protein 2 [Flavobacteriales bacterium]
MRKHQKRYQVVLSLFFFVSFIFLIQLFRIQIVNDDYKFSANNNALRYDVLTPVRGLIYDRDSNLIVSNIPSYNLMVIPREVKEMDTLNLCKLINIEIDLFQRKLDEIKEYSKYKASIFHKQIDYKQASKLQEKLFQFPGFFLQTINTRKYTTKSAAHILGYLGEVNRKKVEQDSYYNNGDLYGVKGIEGGYEKDLRGKKGMSITLVDVYNRKQGEFQEGKFDTLPISGKNIYSTINLELQKYGEKLMKNKKGAIVAIEPETGEILSLISSPSYNPEELSGRKRSKNFQKLLSDKNKPLFNRSLSGLYPPGSIFKLLNGLIALEEKVIHKNKSYNCNNGFEYEKGKLVKCHPHKSLVNLEEAITISCNTYFCKTFTNLFKKHKTTKEAYNNWKSHISSFGIGKWMNNDFVSGAKGLLPEHKYYNKYYGRTSWNSSTIISMAIGQGELLLTPIQMANIAAVIANRGYYYTPHIVKSIEGKQEIDSIFKTKNFTTISPENYDVIINGMEKVVKHPNGTAHNISTEKLIICGKTGTAQNPHGEDHSIFIAFAPKERPKIAIAVYVENAGFGSTWAAPIAGLMLEKYTNTENNKTLEEFILKGKITE